MCLLTLRLHLLLTACMLACPAVTALFEWLRSAPPPAAAPPPPSPPAHLERDAPFEMMTADEKFLAEAKQMELSPLTSCHFSVKPENLHY